MSEDLISTIVNWLPIVVFVAVFLYFSRKSGAYYRKYDQHIADVLNSNAELIAVNREMAKTLAEIRTLLQTGKS